MKLNQDMDVPSALLDALMDSVIQPIVLELAQEAKQPIGVKVVTCFRGGCAERKLNVQAGEGKDAADGEIRVLLKESGQNDFGFAIEAILRGLSPGTGFSGFSLRGKLKLDEGRRSSQVTGRSNRYNVWSWSKDFRFQS